MMNGTHRTDIFTTAVAQWDGNANIGFSDLANAVHSVHHVSSQTAVKAVNRYATMRNWLIGYFIVEYQQKGTDRAVYGERLLKKLEESVQTRGLNVTLFQNCRLFYTLYPQVADLFNVDIQPTASVESTTDSRTLTGSFPKGWMFELDSQESAALKSKILMLR